MNTLNRLSFSCATVVAFVFANFNLVQPAYAMQRYSLVILNSTYQPVSGATVLVDKHKAMWDAETSEYSIEMEDGKTVSAITVSHPAYQKLNYLNYRWGVYSEALYLIKSGEQYYYGGGVKIPCKVVSSALLVSLRHAPGTSPEQCVETARQVLFKKGAAVSKAYWQGQRTKFDPAPGGYARDYMVEVKRTDGKGWGSSSPLLSEIRLDTGLVQFAGTLIRYSTAFSTAGACSGWLNVKFAPGVSETDATRILRDAGLLQIDAEETADSGITMRALAASAGHQAINQLVEKLQSGPGVLLAEPLLFTTGQTY